jgi:hypothetical protein
MELYKLSTNKLKYIPILKIKNHKLYSKIINLNLLVHLSLAYAKNSNRKHIELQSIGKIDLSILFISYYYIYEYIYYIFDIIRNFLGSRILTSIWYSIIIDKCLSIFDTLINIIIIEKFRICNIYNINNWIRITSNIF